MKPIKSIEGTFSGRLTLGLHADLQMRLYAEISKIAAEKILLEAADITRWKTDIDTESDVARRIVASEQTARIAEADKERDQLVTVIFEEIRVAAKSPIVDRAEAGRRLSLVVNAYKGLQRESMAEETAHITGLLTDLNRQQADVNTLSLQTLLSTLASVNSQFSDLRTNRAQAKAAETLPTAAVIRRQNDETMNAVFRHIEAAYLTAATEPDRETLSGLIDRINRIIAETKTTHNASHAKPSGTTPKPQPQPTPEPQHSEEYLRVIELIAQYEQSSQFPAGSVEFLGLAATNGTQRVYKVRMKNGDDDTPFWLALKDGKLEDVEFATEPGTPGGLAVEEVK